MGMQFQPLKLTDSGLFGVRLTGAVSRADKAHLFELADKCLANGKLRIVLEVSELKNLGGGGAMAFAEFQSRLVEMGGEAVFSGAQEVVRRFLENKFQDLPLRFFPDLDSAQEEFFDEADDRVKPEPPKTSRPTFCDEVPDPLPLDEEEPLSSVEAVVSEVEAADFFGEESVIEAENCTQDCSEEIPDDISPGQEMGPEKNVDSGQEVSTARSGRRRDHSYTSLSEAISALGGWSSNGGDRDFGKALDNLLFSHGLAESAIFLARHGDAYQDVDNKYNIPALGSLAKQLADRAQPLTLLDIQDEDLSEEETDLLEVVNPDIMLPVISEGKLGAILFMKRTVGNEEYSVVEHFALELLMRVLSGEETTSNSQAAGNPDASLVLDDFDADQEAEESWHQPKIGDETIADVLLRLALDLPDADDRPHFWRIYARHLWPVLPMKNLGFLDPDKRRVQVVVGENHALQGINLGLNRLKVYFKTMERPVATENLPDFFSEIRTALLDAGVSWLVSLRWEEQYQGTVMFSLESDIGISDEETADLINDLFFETSRMLARFDGSHENADVNLEVVAMLMGQREKRMYGSDDMTRAIVTQLKRLARAMSFPPDQERDLIYGCLLRDLGLMDKEDALMGAPEHMDPVQWSLYRRHPEDGARLLENLAISPSIIEVVRHHHERFSGDGFPQGLSGQAIPLTARVVTVVENYVTMVVGTAIRAPISTEDAARIMQDNLGMRYDPDIVNLFLRAVMPDPDRSAVLY